MNNIHYLFYTGCIKKEDPLKFKLVETFVYLTALTATMHVSAIY